ncbi:MAG: polysaccharide pyruvyl transferase family protein, partial [Coleofasciculus sp. S288]|nr:polysaccharide pyruvyl transferase family protein [Coleofasciculus sp. S288]
EQLGIQQNVKLIPDAALTITRADIPAKAFESVDRILGSHAQMPLLGIHHPRYILADTPQAEAMRTALVSSLAGAPELVPVIFADDGGSKYSEPCERLAQLIQEATDKPCLIVPFKGVWETVALISKLSAVITTKLHVGIIAYALGVYSESFAIHSKVARFYQQIGRSSQCTLFRELDKTICLEKIERAIQMAQSQSSIIDINWQKIKHEASLNQEVVASFLDWVMEARRAA